MPPCTTPTSYHAATEASANTTSGEQPLRTQQRALQFPPTFYNRGDCIIDLGSSDFMEAARQSLSEPLPRVVLGPQWENLSHEFQQDRLEFLEFRRYKEFTSHVLDKVAPYLYAASFALGFFGARWLTNRYW